jgi:FkbM family methyltransferase
MNPPRKLIRLLLFTRNLRIALLAWRLGIPWLHLERQGKRIVIKGTDIPFEFGLQVVSHEGKKTILLDTGEVKLWLDAADVIRVAEEVFGAQEYGLRTSTESFVIDIGMNVATTALYFAKEPQVKKVVAFEPSLLAIGRAERNFAINPEIAKKIEVRRYALGATSGKAYFQDHPEWPAASKIVQNGTSETQGPNQVLVEIRDAEAELQSLLAETRAHQQIILKMDCEGSEREIFRRLSANTLSRIDVILLEWHSPDILDEITQTLQKSAFRVLARRREKGIGMLYAFRQQS